MSDVRDWMEETDSKLLDQIGHMTSSPSSQHRSPDQQALQARAECSQTGDEGTSLTFEVCVQNKIQRSPRGFQAHVCRRGTRERSSFLWLCGATPSLSGDNTISNCDTGSLESRSPIFGMHDLSESSEKNVTIGKIQHQCSRDHTSALRVEGHAAQNKIGGKPGPTHMQQNPAHGIASQRSQSRNIMLKEVGKKERPAEARHDCLEDCHVSYLVMELAGR
jgi:hypothetical protein